MTVISVSTPTNRSGRLAVEACKFGVSADLVDADEQNVYVDLHSDSDYRTIQVGLRAGVTFLAAVDEVEHGEKIRAYPIRQTKDEVTALNAGKPFVW